MACCNTLSIFNSRYNRFFEVPCSYCLNCRVDRRNFLEDCCIHAENVLGTSAFVCLTYDDYRLPSNGSLCRDDFVKFIKRLRSYIIYHSNKFNDKYINPNFDYLAVGEYGDSFNRPHYHILFFGLDSRFIEKILLDCWSGGIVDIGPLENGGIRYVLSYLEKNIKGSLAKQLYDDVGIERPFLSHSQKLCSRFIVDNLDVIRFNDGAYPTGRPNQLRPIPQYWQKVLCLSPFTDLYSVRSSMLAHKKKFSLKEYNAFRKYQASLRQHKLISNARSSGYPVPDDIYSSLVSVSNLSSKDLNYICDIALYGDIVPF